MQKQNLQKLRFFIPYEPKNRMEPTAARNPVNSSILFFLYLLSDAAASTQNKNSLFATNKKNWYIPNGSNNSNKCLQRLSIQLAKQQEALH